MHESYIGVLLEPYSSGLAVGASLTNGATTLSIKDLSVTFCIPLCRYAECRVIFIVKLLVIMLRVIMLSVTVLSVAAP